MITVPAPWRDTPGPTWQLVATMLRNQRREVEERPPVPIPVEARPCPNPVEERSGISMLYDSTKSLLHSILRSLETVDDAGWDDQTESGNACLYEMHQMSRSLYKPFRSDRLNGNALAQDSHPEKLTRAIPHVRSMVIAIRHKNQAQALESGRAALAEMNGTRRSIVSGGRTEPTMESKEAAVVVKVRRVPKQALASSGM